MLFQKSWNLLCITSYVPFHQMAPLGIEATTLAILRVTEFISIVVLKTKARKAVTSNVDLAIHTARDLYQCACDNLVNEPSHPQTKSPSSLHCRRFFYVDHSEIDNNRDRAAFKTIKGTHTLHSVGSVGAEGKVETRFLSCYCLGCLNEIGDCENNSYVEPWKRVIFADVSLSVSESGQESDDESEVEPENESVPEFLPTPTMSRMYEMISADSVVAVQPNVESLSDYFIFCVTSDGVKCLEEDEVCCGHTYPKGTSVLYGFYYELKKTTRKGCFFKKGDKTDLIIPVGCVIYVGIDLEEDADSYLLSHQDHEDIMCSL